MDQDAISPPAFLSFVLFLSEEADSLTQRSVNQKTFTRFIGEEGAEINGKNQCWSRTGKSR